MEHNIHYAHVTRAQLQGMTWDWLKLITAISLPMMGLRWTCDPFLINKSKEFSRTVIKKAILFKKNFIGVTVAYNAVLVSAVQQSESARVRTLVLSYV